MARQKKKRNKPYRGADAKTTRPTIVKVQAENRSAPHQWLVEHRQYKRPALIVLVIIAIIILIISGIVALVQ